MTRRVYLGLAAALILALATPADGQRPPAAAQSLSPAQRAADSARRARLEGEIRRGFARAARQRVGLSDAQIRRLVPLTQRHEQQRRLLQREERETRMELRGLVRAGQSADQARIDQLLRSLVELQKRRVQLVEAEQRDLATVMTPLQRARYMALQEQIRRRLEEVRQRRLPLVEGGSPDGRPIVAPPRARPQR